MSNKRVASAGRSKKWAEKKGVAFGRMTDGFHLTADRCAEAPRQRAAATTWDVLPPWSLLPWAQRHRASDFVKLYRSYLLDVKLPCFISALSKPLELALMLLLGRIANAFIAVSCAASSAASSPSNSSHMGMLTPWSAR